MILQIPIFFALYFVFSKGLVNDPDSIYSFISFPEKLHSNAFGLFDVTQKNIIVALFAGASSFLLAQRQTEGMGESDSPKGEESFQDHFMKSMKLQMLYVLPVIITFSAMFLPAALALYWFVSNMASYGLDIYMKRKLAHLK
jgi:membrane protein insertase Oxa1/YidC/SpoIIIJ